MMGEGGPGPTFDAESKSAKNPYSICGGGGRGRGSRPTFDTESKSAKNPYSLYGSGGWGLGPIFDAESKYAKF